MRASAWIYGCADITRTTHTAQARERYVTAEEAVRLVAAAAAAAGRNKQLSAIINLLLLTGMRVSELLSAR